VSQRLISRNPALKCLRDEGYAVSITGGYLVVADVPYVTDQRTVAYGTLACPIAFTGEEVQPQADHTVRFAGRTPCTSNGARYEKIINTEVSETIAPGLVTTFSFSSKPPSGQYADFHEKMTTYASILETEARTLDPEATARGFRPILDDGTEESVFLYYDSASSRAGINAISARVRGQRIAIVGLGGTGSHILDHVAKTWVQEIHLFDGDLLRPHNPFRMAGVYSADDLATPIPKVDQLAARYAQVRRGVMPHPYQIDETTVDELRSMDFVFLALTDGPTKKIIFDTLEHAGTSFIDCGMGLYKVDGTMLAGVIRTTTSTPSHRRSARQRVPLVDGEQDEYSQNIQISELNALNAVLAVIKWKKLAGVYQDLDDEHACTYMLDGNTMANEENGPDADHDQP
jgi:hypothetical protein